MNGSKNGYAHLPPPPPKPTFCPKREISVNISLGEGPGKVGSFPETYQWSVVNRVPYFKRNHCSRIRREKNSRMPKLNYTSPLRKKKIKQTRTPEGYLLSI